VTCEQTENTQTDTKQGSWVLLLLLLFLFFFSSSPERVFRRPANKTKSTDKAHKIKLFSSANFGSILLGDLLFFLGFSFRWLGCRGGRVAVVVDLLWWPICWPRGENRRGQLAGRS
jgi:hypothetical protein